ncbi:hypothetical protein ACR73B_16685 [Enterococcus innesii]|uniref:hypothetical protein n=1 Tax=Enterococcus TaxID=1350 RepID=UPI003DA63380
MALYLDYTGLSYYDNKVKVWVTDRIKNLTGFTAKAVDALPETGEDNIIYLVKNDESTETQNVYDEYLWINGAFEKLKSTDKIDLSDYYTKSQADTLLAAKQDKLTYDDVPTQGSNNAVTSGTVYTALAAKANAADINSIGNADIDKLFTPGA